MHRDTNPKSPANPISDTPTTYFEPVLRFVLSFVPLYPRRPSADRPPFPILSPPVNWDVESETFDLNAGPDNDARMWRIECTHFGVRSVTGTGMRGEWSGKFGTSELLRPTRLRERERERERVGVCVYEKIKSTCRKCRDAVQNV